MHGDVSIFGSYYLGDMLASLEDYVNSAPDLLSSQWVLALVLPVSHASFFAAGLSY